VTAPLPLAAARERLRKKPGRPRTRPLRPSPPAPLVLPPRVLDLQGAAAYLSVSLRTVERLVAAGTLRRVRVPLPNDAGELRKTLVDRQDLDDLVRAWRETT